MADQIPRQLIFLLLLFFGFCLLVLRMDKTGSYGFSTKSVSMQLVGSSTVYISADRAVVHVQISSEGPKQNKVSDEIKSTLDEVLGLLRPLAKSEQVTTKTPVAVEDISVNALESNSWQRDTIIGQATVYSGRADVQAEFSDIESLGVVLAKLSKMPRLKVGSVLWRLSDELKIKTSAESREKAMNDLLAKGYAYIKPLGLQRIRATSINEVSHHIRALENSNPYGHQWGPRSRLYSSGYAKLQVAHDELGADFYGGGGNRWSEEDKQEAYALESRQLAVSAEVSAACEAY